MQRLKETQEYESKQLTDTQEEVESMAMFHVRLVNQLEMFSTSQTTRQVPMVSKNSDNDVKGRGMGTARINGSCASAATFITRSE
jgi:hypothetical protein